MNESRTGDTCLTRHGLIEDRHHIHRRAHDDEISICEEESGGTRKLALPEELHFPVDGNEVLKKDKHCDVLNIRAVVRMWEIGIATGLKLRG